MQHEETLLIQVVPRLTPTRCGVSDHAIMLADALRLRFGIETAFVILNSEERCEVPYRTVHCDTTQLLGSCRMLSGKRRSALLVHVSGYGYSRDGAPKALATALAELRESGRFPLAAYFHELYATGAPWRSAFWYSRRQQRAVARIAQMCDPVVTNTTHHGSWLQKKIPTSTMLKILSVFSNIGQSETLPHWNQRRPALIVFGQSDTRRRAYEQLLNMTPLIARLKVEEVLDVGADAAVPSRIGVVQVRRMGRMPSTDLSNLISSTQFGFVGYAPNALAKSSVMASLCAFGAVPVLSEPFPGEIDGLSDGKEVVSPNSIETAQLAQCSRAAWNWHKQHDVSVHAAVYADWLIQSKAQQATAR